MDRRSKLGPSPSLRSPLAREEDPQEAVTGAKQYTVSNFGSFLLLLFTSYNFSCKQNACFFS